jgi:hypothetical protein
VDIIKTVEKAKYFNTLEKYHIYKMSKDRFYMNDTYVDTYNPIFETLYQATAHMPQSPIYNRTGSTTQS